MAAEQFDGSTVGVSETRTSTDDVLVVATPEGVLALTVLHHPKHERVGERSLLPELLAGREARMARTQPEFSRPNLLHGEPLGDRYLSRQPLLLRPAPDGAVALIVAGSRTKVRVDGERVRDRAVFDRAQLEHGVVLDLADRIVLLLHRIEPMRPESGDRFGLVGDSPGIVRVRADVRRVADVQVPVLLRGETGTGKELVAHAIHHSSPRRDGPFVSVNLGAIPTTLASSELFGAVKGAFTGSVRHQEGYFRRAHGGTLFLDEVGEAPVEVQVMLLRVLESGELFAVGAQTPHKVDVRLIAATDSNLERKAAAGVFRAPLLHRLAGYELWLPPLRERRDDIGRLLFHFLREELQEIGELHRLTGSADDKRPWLPTSIVSRLARFDWPGNVRQLRNVVRQMVIGSRGMSQVTLGPQIDRALRGEDVAAVDPDATPPTLPPSRPRRRKPSEVDDAELIEALRSQRWDLKATAEVLGVSRTSLYALIEQSPNVRRAGDLAPEEIRSCHQACGGDLEAMVDQLEVSKAALRRRLNELDLA